MLQMNHLDKYYNNSYYKTEVLNLHKQCKLLHFLNIQYMEVGKLLIRLIRKMLIDYMNN